MNLLPVLQLKIRPWTNFSLHFGQSQGVTITYTCHILWGKIACIKQYAVFHDKIAVLIFLGLKIYACLSWNCYTYTAKCSAQRKANTVFLSELFDWKERPDLNCSCAYLQHQYWSVLCFSDVTPLPGPGKRKTCWRVSTLKKMLQRFSDYGFCSFKNIISLFILFEPYPKKCPFIGCITDPLISFTGGNPRNYSRVSLLGL